MSTSLGGAKDAGVKLHVRNAQGGVLKRGTVVGLIVSAGNPLVSFLDLAVNRDFGVGTTRAVEIPYVSVIAAAADSTNPGGVSRLGVVNADIPIGGYGEIVTYGIVQCICLLPVLVGEVITAGVGGVLDAATATDKNPIGFALESKTTGELAWCLINCLNWDGATAFFGGKAY